MAFPEVRIAEKAAQAIDACGKKPCGPSVYAPSPSRLMERLGYKCDGIVIADLTNRYWLRSYDIGDVFDEGNVFTEEGLTCGSI